MKKLVFLRVIGGLALIAALSAIVMLLWNGLIPAIFGLMAINFWQALGLLALARILFGSFGFGRSAMMMQGMNDNPIRKKWMKMTPEQRMEFINKRHQFGFMHPFGKDRLHTENQDEQGYEPK